MSTNENRINITCRRQNLSDEQREREGQREFSAVAWPQGQKKQQQQQSLVFLSTKFKCLH